ncbi:MAG: ABC transporter permease [Anaerolineae bacterium]
MGRWTAETTTWLRLYPRLIRAQIRSQMEYRMSFVAEVIGSLLITALDFVGLLFLLTRFRSIGGWTLPEVAFLYGTSAVSFALAEMLSGAFDRFDWYIVRGEFDRMLIRPLGLIFQVLTAHFPLRRLGRMSQGMLALAVALHLLEPRWGWLQWGFLGVTIVSGVVLFMGIFVLGATASFWSPQTYEITNSLTYGGTFMTSYPMNIYREWMRDLFTFVIPMAFINYYPALYLLGKPFPSDLPRWVGFLSPAIAALFLWGSLRLWWIGVGRYHSTGH